MNSLSQEKRCNACGETKPSDAFHKSKGRPDGLQTYCKGCFRTVYGRSESSRAASRRYKERNYDAQLARTRAWRETAAGEAAYKRAKGRSLEHYRKIRDACVDKFGAKCNHCGFTDRRCLHIDHVFGDGKRERATMGQYAFYRAVLDDTTGRYQLLCANCNWIKRLTTDQRRSGRPPTRNESE